MTSLPPELRRYDGDPLATLAARVIADLARVGVPAHFIDLDDGAVDDSHVVNGIRLSIAGNELLLGWHLPDELSLKGLERNRAFSAAAALTTTVVGILVNCGYQLRTEFADPDFPYPYVYMAVQDV